MKWGLNLFFVLFSLCAYPSEPKEDLSLSTYDAYVENYKPRLMTLTPTLPMDLAEVKIIQKELQTREQQQSILLLQQKSIPWSLVSLFSALALLLGLYIYKLNLLQNLHKPKVTLPPEKIAVDRLNNLFSMQLHNQNNFKAYYTELKNIIDAYLEDKFQLAASVKTCEEMAQNPELKKIMALKNAVWLEEWILKANRIIYGGSPVQLNECLEDTKKMFSFFQ